MAERVSSRMTFFYKWVFPIIWFGGIAVVLVMGISSQFTAHRAPPQFLIMPIILTAFGYWLMRTLCFDLVDEVIDYGDHLRVKNRGQADQIQFSEIQEIDYQYLSNPPRVSLTLRVSSKFGKKVTFMPAAEWIPFGRSRRIEELIARIQKLKNGSNQAK